MQKGMFAETGLDKSIPYISVLMEKSDAAHYPRYALPDGYCFRDYEPGMEEEIVQLQFSVGGTDNAEFAQEIFMREFSQDLDALKTRMISVTAANGVCAGTAYLWHGSHFGGDQPRVHWVTVHPEHQNKGLSKAILTRLFDLQQALSLGQYIYLVTQTWSYKAINIYTEFGFNPYIGEKPVNFVSENFENENNLAWNLIYDQIELYEAAKRKEETNE